MVDADTGKPIDGAVILEVFYLWPRRGFGNFPVSKVFRDSAQALTDGEGRFTLSGPFDRLSWWTDGLHIFKPSYGPWRFRGENEVKPLTEAEEWSWRRQTWDRFTTSGVVIELRPLRTREERLKYIDRGWAPSDVLEAGFHRDTPTPFGFYFFDVPLDRLTDYQRAVGIGIHARYPDPAALTPNQLKGTIGCVRTRNQDINELADFLEGNCKNEPKTTSMVMESGVLHELVESEFQCCALPGRRCNLESPWRQQRGNKATRSPFTGACCLLLVGRRREKLPTQSSTI